MARVCTKYFLVFVSLGFLRPTWNIHSFFLLILKVSSFWSFFYVKIVGYSVRQIEIYGGHFSYLITFHECCRMYAYRFFSRSTGTVQNKLINVSVRWSFFSSPPFFSFWEWGYSIFKFDIYMSREIFFFFFSECSIWKILPLWHTYVQYRIEEDITIQTYRDTTQTYHLLLLKWYPFFCTYAQKMPKKSHILLSGFPRKIFMKHTAVLRWFRRKCKKW